MADRRMIEIIRPRLLGLLAEGKAMDHVPHDGVMGRFRELAIEKMVKPFIPPSVVATNGTIVFPNAKRQVRNEDDIVLFSLERAPLLVDGTPAIIPIKGVLANVEVKSTLRRNDVCKAVKAAIELRDFMPRDEKAPASLIFAYTSDNSKQTEVKRLMSVLDALNFCPTSGQASSPIQCICVADRGTWLLLDLEGRKAGWYFVRCGEDVRHILCFVSILSNYCYIEERDAHGVGTYFLDLEWLGEPEMECPVTVP